jgi:hypothetical protein
MLQLKTFEQRWVAKVLALACFLLFFALGLWATLSLAPTNDEPSHFLRGFVLSETGSLQFQTGHAPLSHRLIGILLSGEPSLPTPQALPSWPDGERLQLADELMWQSGIDVDRVLFLARLPILWVSILLGALIGSWAFTWHGRGAMIVALVLFAASPNLLASATLATTDFVTVFTYFGTIYAWWRYWRRPSWRWWLLTAVFLGLALAAKLTAILLLPVLFLLTFLFLGKGKSIWRPFMAFLLLLPAAAIVSWLVYGLQVGQVSGWPWTVPAPAYITSWQNVLDHVERGHRAFFLGELSGEGWWSYFPLTFLIKTPLVTLVLLVTGLLVIASRRDLWPTAVFLILPVGSLFAAAMTSRLNIGYRHILPIIPFVLVLASTAVLFLSRWTVTRTLLLLALTWYVLAAMRQQPHFLAYFNELVGGTSQGYRYLGDSNLDWGQDLKELAREVGDGKNWIISYAGAADPAYYGIDSSQLVDLESGVLPFAPANPGPGRYAISANHWQGILEDADLFDWFRRQDIYKNLGGSILIYDVQERAAGEWVAHCVDPAPLLAVEEAEAILGRSGLRHVWFDCSSSWVLPNGDAPGWYILPQADAWWPEDALSAEDDDLLQHVYRHRAAAGAPSYDVYYWPGGDLEPDPQKSLYHADVNDQDVTLPYTTGDLATLTGYQVNPDAWITFWQIEASPDQPVSLRAHLYSLANPTPLVDDGLGYSGEQWQAGDTLWQQHQFETMEDAAYLETGLYDYQTLGIIGEVLDLPVSEAEN